MQFKIKLFNFKLLGPFLFICVKQSIYLLVVLHKGEYFGNIKLVPISGILDILK